MIHVITGMVRDEFIFMRRYPLNTVSAVVTGYVIFLMLFLGVRTVMGPASLGSTTASLVIGYWVFLLTNISFQNFGYYISEQAMVGTLEQLYLSPMGVGWIALGKMISVLLFNLMISVPFLFLMMLTTGQWFNIDVPSVLPLVLTTVLQAYGIGLVMAGLVLVHKRIQALYQIVSMLMVVFLVAPPEASPLVHWLPLNLPWRLLRTVMADGVPLWMLPARQTLFVFTYTLLLFGAGWGVYAWCERLSRRRGSLGQY